MRRAELYCSVIFLFNCLPFFYVSAMVLLGGKKIEELGIEFVAQSILQATFMFLLFAQMLTYGAFANGVDDDFKNEVMEVRNDAIKLQIHASAGQVFVEKPSHDDDWGDVSSDTGK